MATIQLRWLVIAGRCGSRLECGTLVDAVLGGSAGRCGTLVDAVLGGSAGLLLTRCWAAGRCGTLVTRRGGLRSRPAALFEHRALHQGRCSLVSRAVGESWCPRAVGESWCPRAVGEVFSGVPGGRGELVSPGGRGLQHGGRLASRPPTLTRGMKALWGRTCSSSAELETETQRNSSLGNEGSDSRSCSHNNEQKKKEISLSAVCRHGGLQLQVQPRGGAGGPVYICTAAALL
ncbi:unnamed protein product [Boreogadus saida]